jgi:dTDP-4-amino-4,6-dideoxygalactose transaminase
VPQGYEHGWQAYVCWFCPDEAQEALARRDQAAIDALHARRNAVMAALEERGIATRQGTHAVHIQRLYADRYGYAPMDFPVAYAADRLSFALPFYPQMTEAEADYLFTTLKEMRP